MFIITEITNTEINRAAKQANPNPSDAQKKSGNYKMGHVKIKGFDVTIENPRGSKRYYENPDGTKGYNVMKHHYGYFKKTEGYDGDAVDVFIGNYLDFDKIFVVDQNKSDGSFDESKVMLGFKTKQDAKNAYMANFSKNWKGFRTITEVSVDGFKEWLYDGKKQKKPFAEYKSIKENNELKTNNMKKTITLNETQLKTIVTESVKRILKEARLGRGTITKTDSSWSGDEYGGTTSNFFKTEENPFSNDTVQMLADRLEKRLGGKYRVEAHANPYMSGKYDWDSDKMNYKTHLVKVDFVIERKAENDFQDSYIEKQDIDDVVRIAKVAKQLLYNMAEKVYVSGVNYAEDNGIDSNDSITVTALLRNVNEPRKDMIPRRKYDINGDTGYANSNFTKPSVWHTTEN